LSQVEKDELNEEVVTEDVADPEAIEADPEVVVEEEKPEPTCEELLAASEDKFLRTHAEFENIKKRLEREKYDAIDYSQEKFAKDLLTTLDSLDAALKIDDETQFAQLKEGMQLTYDSLVKAFEKHNILKVDHEGGFDPEKHEAVMQVPSEEHDDNDVVQVLQQGYQYRTRVLRPSLVSICKK
jgi:molecular chaperone GrpE